MYFLDIIKKNKIVNKKKYIFFECTQKNKKPDILKQGFKKTKKYKKIIKCL